MKAIVCDKYDSLDDLKIKEVSMPKIKDHELLIRVMACTVASGDCVVRKASNPFVKLTFGLRKPRKSILGTDFAGVVAQIGEKVTKFAVGDRVVASTGMKFGGQAEYTALSQDAAIVKIPSSLSFQEASVLAFGGNAALHFLRKMGNERGSKLLVYGASGAVGSSTVQLAKYLGFEVTGVCSATNSELVRSLGADAVFDYTQADWMNDLGHYDFVFDAVGKTKKEEWKDHLVSGGSFYSIAKGLVKESPEYLALLVKLAAKKQIVPVIDRVYPMEQAREAYTYVESGRKKGNVVLSFD